jgi:hypothetical protein
MPDEAVRNVLGFLNVLRRGTTIDIQAEHFGYSTTTEILDSEPDGRGGLTLTLNATIEEGELVVTEAMIAGAEHDGDCWCIRHGGLVFRFGLWEEGEPAFGPAASSRTTPRHGRNTINMCESEMRGGRPDVPSRKVAS